MAIVCVAECRLGAARPDLRENALIAAGRSAAALYFLGPPIQNNSSTKDDIALLWQGYDALANAEKSSRLH